MRSGEALAVLISLGISFLTVVGGVVVIMAALRYRLQMRELRHKERLAMIDKGLLPPPEFETAATLVPQQRSRSFGIVVIGVGFALMFLIGIAGGALESGIGIGGATAILGAAFVVRSYFASSPAGPLPHTPPPPAGAPSDTLRP